MQPRTLIILFVFLFTACGPIGVDDLPGVFSSTPTVVIDPPRETVVLSTPDAVNPPTITQTLPKMSPTVTATLTPAPATKSPPSITPTPSRLSRLPDADAYSWVAVVAGLRAPVGLAYPADGSGRLFIIEQPGRILFWDHENLLASPFLDITDRVGSGGSEQGLLGLAFHPRYAENGYFYVNYTNPQGDTVIARFNVSADDPNSAIPESELRLLHVPQPYRNHNGGMLAFGKDGYLYLGLGDGGSAGDPQGNGQSLASLLGKLLRIDVDRMVPYSIPQDNPYASGGGEPEIWLYGLRNPWRFAFDRLTGDLYIGDVGQDQWEEINYFPAESPGGANFGWSYYEGSHPYSGSPPADLSLIPPVAEYGHDQGCSVTGGVVYRGAQLPAWQGVYLYGDYCSGRVWGLVRDAQNRWVSAPLFDGMGRISSFGEDESGEVYLVDHGGRIFQLVKK